MMKRILVLTAMIAFLCSCAEKATVISTDFWDESFSAWVKNHDPDAEKVGNIYINYFQHYPDASPYNLYDNESWVLVNYTGRTLDGDVFVTRSDSLAKLLGTWSEYAHYSAQFANFAPSSYTLFTPGFCEALRNMNVGDSARVYIPASLSTPTTINFGTGFTGSVSDYANFPMMYDIRLKAITNNPSRFEMDTLAKFARKHWGMEPRDTLTTGIYFRKIKENPDGYPITTDSTAYVYYTHAFLDGFIVDTNIDTVALKYNIYQEEQTSRYDVKVLNINLSGVDDALTYAATNMRRGEIAEIAVISYYAQGVNGVSAGSSNYLIDIGPYTPMLFTVYTEDNNGNSEGDD